MNPNAAIEPEIPVKLVSSTAVLRHEVARYLAAPHRARPPQPRREPAGRGVLVTGATGLLGSAIVGRLLADPARGPVHCLVRAADPAAGLARVRAALQRRRAWRDEHAARLRIVCGDLTQPWLGLAEAELAALRASLADVVHCGAHLNFLATYRTLRAANVDGTLALVDALCAPAGVHLHHVSSAGVMTGAGFPAEAPEQHDYCGYDAELVGGYTQTKWVADQVLCGLQRRGWPISILRPAHVVDLEAPYTEPSPLVEFYLTQLRTGTLPQVPFRFYFTPLAPMADATVALLDGTPAQRHACHHLVGEPVEHTAMQAELAARGAALAPMPLAAWKQHVQAACLANRWEFAALLPYVAAMTPERLQLGRLRTDNAASLGFCSPVGARWDAATFADFVLRAHRQTAPVPTAAAAPAPASTPATPAVAALPASEAACDIYDFDGVRRLAERLGGAFTMPHKGRQLVVVTDAAIARHILVDHFLDYRKGLGMMGQFGEVLGKGLFTNDGDAWARDRKLLAPAFQGRLVERFEALFTEHTEAFVARLRPLVGQPLDVHPLVSRYSLGLAADCFFSVKDVGDFPYEAIDRLKYLVKEFRHDLRSIPRETFVQAQASYRAFRGYVHGLVAARRAAAGTHQDVFEQLATDPSLTADEVFGQVSSLIAASYDTTNVALGFLWQMLAQHPDEQELLRAEVRQHGPVLRQQDLRKLRRTRAFLDETLRLHPPVWAIPRFSTTEHVVQGRRLPAQVDYLIYTWLIQRSPRYWTEPDHFRPARFLDGHEPTDAAAFHPFSLGKRTCIGMGFALHEMLHLAARLLGEFRLVAVPGEGAVVPLYPVLGTTTPIRVVLETL